MRVLGIDPGTRLVGYGLVSADGNRYRAQEYGVVTVESGLPFPEKLLCIYNEISSLIERLHPDAAAVEETYVTQNAKTTLRLGHARGVILLALAGKGLPVGEYAPRSVKQAVSGRGNASKEQVQWMVTQILGLQGAVIAEDASDALAISLCHLLRNEHGTLR
ncbi:crossover junction endodeoxyribonuclease RuvC [bacterium]|nr:crossover junction endodeoxyribonuclease RuvC [bacterium]